MKTEVDASSELKDIEAIEMYKSILYPFELSESFLGTGDLKKVRTYCEFGMHKTKEQVSDMKLGDFKECTICKDCLERLNIDIRKHLEVKGINLKHEYSKVVNRIEMNFMVEWKKKTSEKNENYSITLKNFDQAKAFKKDLAKIPGVYDLTFYEIEEIKYEYKK